MKFRTEISPLNHRGLIDYDSCIVMIGSCFTDEIGAKLRYQMFDTQVNPIGTIYNPVSIAYEILRALGAYAVPAELVQLGDRWLTYSRHSSFSAPSRDEMEALFQQNVSQFGELLRSATHIIITLGSAVGFRQRATGSIVVNCHKQHPSEFERVEFEVWECVNALRGAIQVIRTINPSLKVILTVSPVRHAGYGLIADRLSKSTLIVTCHRLCRELRGCIYFPSYEALVDDLRDYRFYADDLAHPAPAAVEYIYDLFRESFMTTATIDLANRWGKLTSRLAHRFFDPAAEVPFREETFNLAGRLANETPNGQAALKRFKEWN